MIDPRARGTTRRARQPREGHGLAHPGPHRRRRRARAAALTYGLLVSRDGGRSYDVAASRRRRPFSKSVRIRGARKNVLVATACDGNGNCGVKVLGRFRRR